MKASMEGEERNFGLQPRSRNTLASQIARWPSPARSLTLSRELNLQVCLHSSSHSLQEQLRGRS